MLERADELVGQLVVAGQLVVVVASGSARMELGGIRSDGGAGSGARPNHPLGVETIGDQDVDEFVRIGVATSAPESLATAGLVALDLGRRPWRYRAGVEA